MKKRYLINQLLEQSAPSGETMPLQPLVELCANKRVLVENHNGVTEYSDGRIGVAVRFGTVLVIGDNLQLNRITKCQLVICGNIQSIQLLKG